MSLELDWSDDQFNTANLDKKKVLSIARRLAQLSKEMKNVGLSVYGNGTGYLIHESQPTHFDNGEINPDSIIAVIGSCYNGGDW